MTDAYFTVVCRAPENQGGDYRVAAEHLRATGLEDAKTLHSAHVQGLVAASRPEDCPVLAVLIRIPVPAAVCPSCGGRAVPAALAGQSLN